MIPLLPARIAAVLGLCFVLPGVMAQPVWKPERAVEVVVGASPGGGTDITARVLQKILQEQGSVDSSVVVNMPGGSHTLAWAYLGPHAGDAHYFSIVNEPFITNRMIGVSPLSYRDFTPLTVLFNEYIVFVVKGVERRDNFSEPYSASGNVRPAGVEHCRSRGVNSEA